VRKRQVDRKRRDGDARLLRQWHKFHREQLEAALAGPHGAVLGRLMKFLETLTPKSMPALIGQIEAPAWQLADAQTRFVALHEINDAIAAVREHHGMPPLDDALPHQRLNGFLIIRALLQ
jgi:hypothetical protein